MDEMQEFCLIKKIARQIVGKNRIKNMEKISDNKVMVRISIRSRSDGSPLIRDPSFQSNSHIMVELKDRFLVLLIALDMVSARARRFDLADPKSLENAKHFIDGNMQRLTKLANAEWFRRGAPACGKSCEMIVKGLFWKINSDSVLKAEGIGWPNHE